MTNRLKKGVKLIPASEVFAEWRKDPEYMREYERQKPEFDRIRRQIHAKKARRAWRAAQLAHVRESVRSVWHWLTRSADQVATS